MVATPIPQHLVHTVLQYILPPSLPLPAHLLSKRLLERHHFLSISPTDPTSYLCWPSSDAAQVIEALECGSQGELPEHEVRYTAPDGETVLAHVRPDAQSPVLIVFVWDVATESWRYHDARLLPFPVVSSPSLDITLENGPDVTLGLEWPSASSDQPRYELRSSSPGSDNYWEGYESSGSSPETSAMPPSVFIEEEDKAEAAYWASYSVVHGSGDSTVPSPRHEKDRSHHRTAPDSRGPETTFDPLVAHLHLRLQNENGLLSPRFFHPESSPSPQSAKEDGDILDSDPASGEVGAVSLESDHQLENDDSKPNEPEVLVGGSSDVAVKNDDNEGLKEVVRGLYRMWRTESGSDDAGAFVEIVKNALNI
ncbi:hypothetical protein K439DRAFT_608735 [Ramaria rubella]|nr:hypothetical protein K439DRAFT_608735 [Ramaria rubella]